MKRNVFIFILTMILLLPVLVLASPPSDKYQLLFEDNFEGDKLNEDNWVYRSGVGYGGHNVPENVDVDGNGRMRVFAKQEADGTYTCGGVVTRFPLGYGYYETKTKTFNGTGGLHTSFWTAGPANPESDRDIYKAGGGTAIEIDAYEIDSESPGVIKMGYIDWLLDRSGHAYSILPYREIDTSAEDFVLGFEWLPDRIVYYVNGEKVKEDLNPKFYGNSHVWLTALIMPEIRAQLIDAAKLPGFSSWDYFKYYAMPIEGANLMGDSSFEYTNGMIGTKETASLPDLSNVHALFRRGTKEATFARGGNDAHSGYYYLMHSFDEDYEVLSSQKKFCIPNGEYTFSAYVRSSGGQEAAYLGAYDRDGNLICKQDIPETKDVWTKVTLPVTVTDNFIDVGVYSKATKDQWLKIDDWFFGISEGATSEYSIKENYEIRFTTLPENENPINSIVVDLEDDRCVAVGDWRKSAAAQGTYWLAGTDVDGTANEGEMVTWTIEVPEDGNYIFEFLNPCNPGSDTVTITITTPYEEKTFNENQFNGNTEWKNYGEFNLKKDDKIVAVLTPGNVGCTRAGSVRLSPSDTFDTLSEKQIIERQLIMAINQRWALNQNRRIAIDDNTNVVPFIENGRTLVPLRFIAEALGAEVAYDGATQKITITLGADVVELYVGGMEISVNGESKPLDVAANLYYDRTFVPLRAVSEAFNKIVTWHNSGLIYIGDVAAEFGNNNDLLASCVIKDLNPILEAKKDITFDTVEKYSDEILMMNKGTEGFTTEGNWQPSGVMSGSIYSVGNGATCKWEPILPADGKYVVEFYNVGHSSPGYNVKIKAGEVEAITNLSGTTYKGGWYNLGTYDMKIDGDNVVSAWGPADTRVIKVRFIPLETYEKEKKPELTLEEVEIVPVEVPEAVEAEQIAVKVDSVASYKNQVVLDSDDKSATSKGSWLNAVAGGKYLNSSEGYYKWNPVIEEDGKYRVQFYNLGSDTTAFNLEVVNADGEGAACAIKANANLPTGWFDLGTYEFKKGSENFIRTWGGKYIRCVEIRIIPEDIYEDKKKNSDNIEVASSKTTFCVEEKYSEEASNGAHASTENSSDSTLSTDFKFDDVDKYRNQIEIKNIGAKEFSSTGKWSPTSIVSGGIYLENGDGESYCKWNPEIPEDGEYVVEFYLVGHTSSKIHKVEVKTADGENKTFGLDCAKNDTGYYNLGTYKLKKGTDNFVKLTGGLDTRALKVRFIPINQYNKKN